REGGRDRVLVDPNGMDATNTTSVTLMGTSNDGAIAAFAYRIGGADEVELRLLDVATGKPLDDVLPRARYYSVALPDDRTGFWYSQQMDDGPRVRWHAMGTAPSADVDVFGKGLDAGQGVSASLSHDGKRLLLITWYGSASPQTDIHVMDAKPGAAIVPIVVD